MMGITALAQREDVRMLYEEQVVFGPRKVCGVVAFGPACFGEACPSPSNLSVYGLFEELLLQVPSGFVVRAAQVAHLHLGRHAMRANSPLR